MAGSVNRVTLIGNLCADPEIRRLQSGDPVVNIRVATSESWRDKNSGDRKEKTEFHNVVIFNEHIAKVAEQYLRKGAKVYVEGSIQTRKWQDQSGQDRYSTEVVLQKFRGELQMLDAAGSRDDAEREKAEKHSNQRTSGEGMYGGGAAALDDSIPFAPEWR